MSKLNKTTRIGVRLATVSFAAMLALGISSAASAQDSSDYLISFEDFLEAS